MLHPLIYILSIIINCWLFMMRTFYAAYYSTDALYYCRCNVRCESRFVGANMFDVLL